MLDYIFKKEIWPVFFATCLSALIFVFWLSDGLHEGIRSTFVIFYWRSNSFYELIYGGLFLGIFICSVMCFFQKSRSVTHFFLAMQGHILEISVFFKINLGLIFLYQSGRIGYPLAGVPIIMVCIVTILLLVRYETQASWREIFKGLGANLLGSMILALIMFDNMEI